MSKRKKEVPMKEHIFAHNRDGPTMTCSEKDDASTISTARQSMTMSGYPDSDGAPTYDGA
jgi:hypothetical protein